jgi:hypothetical protein
MAVLSPVPLSKRSAVQQFEFAHDNQPDPPACLAVAHGRSRAQIFPLQRDRPADEPSPYRRSSVAASRNRRNDHNPDRPR